MKAKHVGIAIGLALVLLGAVPRPSRAAQVRVDVRVELFHDRLTPYGMWITGRYGRCWVPRGRPSGWRPYTLGYWTYSDLGWVWVSDEPFGWATYHYGRWYLDPSYGWVWVPDTEWGPAWVAWRSSNDYVGWAPLPPGVAVVYGSPWDPAIDFVSFTFVRTRYLTSREVRMYYEPPARNSFYVRATINTTRFEGQNSRVFNRGVGVDVVERATGRAVPRMTVQTSDQPGAARVERDRVVVYRPTGPTGGERATAGPAAADRGHAPAVTTTTPNRGRVTTTAPARGKATPQDERRGAGPAHNPPPADNNHGRSAGPARSGPPPKQAPADHGRAAGPPPRGGPAQQPDDHGRGKKAPPDDKNKGGNDSKKG